MQVPFEVVQLRLLHFNFISTSDLVQILPLHLDKIRSVN